MEWGDTEERGLTLRLTPQALTWYLRTRTDTVKLGAYHLLDVTQARCAAEKAKVGLRQGDNMKFEMSVFHNIMARTGPG
ncbi:integrase arm-type DNA-binding domain-containing protein, partial [Escherichia coli]|uniref:integrase arm-type DNA-binding domain-containing protein n=1 Tax=Escherichia coli TaxID=562 RepID=UPI0013D0AE3E